MAPDEGLTTILPLSPEYMTPQSWQPEALERAARLLRNAGQLVISTGAGMSRESGIPTFRDSQTGIWSRFDPADLATEEAFRRDPIRVSAWYRERRLAMAGCVAHAGHAALVELEKCLPAVTIVTQNIDGLHQRSGSSDVIELHGSITREKCLECGGMDRGTPAAGNAPVAECASCGGLLRPDVVWFGEMLPAEAVERAWSLVPRADALLVVGTSGVVWPAAELPLVARRAGVPVIEISPEPTEVTPSADIFLPGPAGTVLPALVAAVRSK